MKIEIDLCQLKNEIAQEVVARLKPLIRPQDQGQEEDFSSKTLAEHLGIPIRKVYEMTRKKEVPFYKVGIKLRFRPTDIAKWKFATFIPAVNSQQKEIIE